MQPLFAATLPSVLRFHFRLSMATPAFVRPYYRADGDRVTVGVEVSHGMDLTMQFPLEWIENVNWEVEYRNEPEGTTCSIVAVIDSVTGNNFRVGARTLHAEPWIMPIVGGKGYGRGRPGALPLAH